MKNIILFLSFAVLLFAGSSSVFKQNHTSGEKIKLLYVYDPLCGWCYAFGPNVERIEKEYDAEVTIISGGMVLGERIRPVGNMASYILKSIPKMEKTTGVKYGEAYKNLLREGTYQTSSEKPSVALCVYKSFKKDSAVSFAHDIQSSFFIDAKDLNKNETYADLAVSYGIERNSFLERMKDSMYLKQAYAEFKRAGDLQLDGYPYLFLVKDSTLYLVADGYLAYDYVSKNLKKAMKK
jgi:putative protein-disulfide isomerase